MSDNSKQWNAGATWHKKQPRRTKAPTWISMADGDRVVTTPVVQPFSEALKQKHVSDHARICTKCGAIAVVNLAPHLLAAQPDGTTHVCHPVLGGCNHGFEVKK